MHNFTQVIIFHLAQSEDDRNKKNDQERGTEYCCERTGAKRILIGRRKLLRAGFALTVSSRFCFCFCLFFIFFFFSDHVTRYPLP